MCEKTKTTSLDLRNLLLNEIYSLRSGKTTPVRARAVAQLANSILKSTEIEVDIIKHCPELYENTEKIGRLELGTEKCQ